MLKIFKHPVLLETACGHDGSEKILKKLTDIAIAVRAKQIKYQLFNIEERALPNTKEDKIFKPLCLEKKMLIIKKRFIVLNYRVQQKEMNWH